MDLLRINTAGSVDDGKSTLIGRLLYDTHSLTREQEELIARRTAEKGMLDLDFSVITDGLIAEREQGITIDVAHIYFSTADRKFIIADSPGHIEYTRNMVTGASNSEVSVILIDARKGLLEQSFRHFFISQLLRMEAVVFCVNKMDLVDYSEDVFLQIGMQIEQMIAASTRPVPPIHVLPISSLKGDNVVAPSQHMPWYHGSTLDTLLHQIEPRKRGEEPFRMEIQQVLHVQNAQFTDFRGFAGQVASGTIAVGDRILVLPSAREAQVTEIRKYDRTFPKAEAGDSVILSLDAEVDASRGALFVRPDERPVEARSVRATLVWLDEVPASLGGKYLLQAGARAVQTKLQEVSYLIPPEQPQATLEAQGLKLNDIGVVELRLAQPIYLDEYATNKANGAFILVDLQRNHTCAVGFVES